jgi:hypothetical protein
MLLTSPDFDRYVIPPTGAQLCRLARYRLLRPLTDDDLETVEGLTAEATAYRDLYSKDYRINECQTDPPLMT